MSLSRADVEKVALLARLELEPGQIDSLSAELAQIVGYVDQLAELDTSGVEPMAHAVEQFNVLAEDVPDESLDRAVALSTAPSHDDECYLVPAVLGL